jgi:ADP-ribose 1''-phosphate phosphatase
MGLSYQKMSIFDAPQGSLLVHACNCKGVWGSGIAKEFADRYPEAFLKYKKYTSGYDHNQIIGTFFLHDFIPNQFHKVGCLFTSVGYGRYKSPEKDILEYTESAIKDCLEYMSYLCSAMQPIIYSNKFNSGLFGIPWEKTELILANQLQGYPEIQWIVCEID